MTFEYKYENIKKIVKNELEYIEDFMVQQIKVKEPLNSFIVNFLTAPSKRIRPVLSILYYKSKNDNISKDQLKSLTAIELIHNASLIHDDIIDNSDTRRGLKTISHEFGNHLGVISGDYLLSRAMNIMTELKSLNLLKNLSAVLNKMCIGEINQNFAKFQIGTIEDYIEKSKNKTAYLFQSAILAPFILSNLKENDNASQFGLNTGIAFQIRDDLLNLISNDKTKPNKNDIAEGIYNAPVIYSQSAENYISGVEKTKNLLSNYINRAAFNISDLPDNQYKEGLKQFLELLNHD